MLALEFKQCKSNTGMYYFIDKKIRKLVTAIIYINNVCFISSKYFLLLLKLKWKFITKWECCNFGETKKFFRMCISCNHKDQEIFVNQSEYLIKVLIYFNITTNLTSTLLLLGYIYLIIGSCPDIEFSIVKLT